MANISNTTESTKIYIKIATTKQLEEIKYRNCAYLMAMKCKASTREKEKKPFITKPIRMYKPAINFFFAYILFWCVRDVHFVLHDCITFFLLNTHSLFGMEYFFFLSFLFFLVGKQ